MAGVKGRSGGARPNTGGARPGAGRKPKQPEIIALPVVDDPKEFLLKMMNDNTADVRQRIDAAKALMPFVHVKLGEGGKKDERADKAKKAATGKFSAAPAPLKLVRK